MLNEAGNVIGKIKRVVIEREDATFELIGEEAEKWDNFITSATVMMVIHGNKVTPFAWTEVKNQSVTNRVTNVLATIKETSQAARAKVESKVASSMLSLGSNLMTYGTKKMFPNGVATGSKEETANGQ